MNTLTDKQFDKKFNEIKGLTWYPWVGKNYSEKGFKILVIGESQYAVDEDGEFCEETSEAFLKDKETSREFFFDAVEQTEWTKSFYTSLFKTYLEEISASRLKSFAENISFYHFYQTVDEKVSGNNRNKIERLMSWKIWSEVVNTLKPDVCIVHGMMMYKYFDVFCDNNDKEYQWEDLDSGFYEKGQQPIKAEYKLDDGKITNLLFLRHTSSRGYSSQLWREFLHNQFPGLIQNI